MGYKNMNHNINKIEMFTKCKLFICLFLSGIFIVLGCGKSNPSGGDGGSPSTTDDVNGSNDNPPEKNYLWIHHKSVTGSLRYTHKSVAVGSSWTENKCQVDLDAASAAERDIMCITESAELDLMYLGLKLEFNVPEHSKCIYAITMSPYFMRYEPPHLVSPYDEDGTNLQKIPPRYVYEYSNESTGKYAVFGYYGDPGSPINENGTPTIAPTAVVNTNIALTSSEGVNGYRCKFDYSDLIGGSNCCSGDYIFISRSIASDGTDTIRRSNKSWGGNPANCLSGPALTLQKKNEWTDFPIDTYWRKKDESDALLFKEMNKFSSKKFQSPIEIMSDIKSYVADDTSEGPAFGKFEMNGIIENYGSTQYLANYFTTEPKPFEVLTGGESKNDSSNIIYYGYHGGVSQGYQINLRWRDPRYFTVLCADSNREIYARIQLQVREWNTYDNLKKGVEQVSGEDDIVGAETDFPEYGKGDFSDWNDLSVGSYPGSGL